MGRGEQGWPMECVLLGSGGWIPTDTRETCSALIRHGSDVVVIDAGTGLRRLLERRDLVADAATVHIVLTHFHLDHVIGLSYLPGLPLNEPPVVWGPGERLAGVSTRLLLERLLGPPLFAAPLTSLVHDVREVPEGEFQLESFTITTRVQRRHSDPTLAYRIGDALTYCTDTASDPGNATFASGSGVLLHEAWDATATTRAQGHSSADQAARIAREAIVGRLVLIHINPLLDGDEELTDAARFEFAPSEVGSDLTVIPLS